MSSPLSFQIPSPSASPQPLFSPSSSSSSSSSSASSTPSPVTVIVQDALSGRLSANSQSVSKSLDWALEFDGEQLLPHISTLVSDIIAICDSFVPENIPDEWKKKFASVRDDVKPTHLKGVAIARLTQRSRDYLVQTFPKLQTLFPKVQSIALVAIKQVNK